MTEGADRKVGRIDGPARAVDDAATEWTVVDHFTGTTFRGRAEAIGRSGQPVSPGSDVDVLFWRASCRSGWSGQLWPNLADSSDLSPEMRERLHLEWAKHVLTAAPLLGIETKQAEISRLEKELKERKYELTDYVCAAREQNLSWAKIGDAAGISKQAAQKRWEREDPRRIAKLHKKVASTSDELQAQVDPSTPDTSDPA
ncbi:hypothetical protein MYP14_25205 (plasmid) [Rhodococcus pyridinivorans]|uniref:hypothetical protein n=1 Tax=Rhodococcus pyridinivorans TaxID=103816 RepID=UPI0006873A4A|nr:hypothetical protein [Rhodococcus pyridinivorans]UPK66526.1 hypothetical protein MYP14_25205 [Rhodococcus pyridinivorans]